MAKPSIEVHTGDITVLEVDAVVNAANSQLAGGGGVDGAIHQAAGYQQLQAACQALGSCPTGEVRLTSGFNLPAKAIIHTVGPIWQDGGHNEHALLAACYSNTMTLAEAEGFSSLAFPAISCGVYGFPLDEAVEIAVREVSSALVEAIVIERVIFCCFDREMAKRYESALSPF